MIKNGEKIILEIAGVGIVFYSPSSLKDFKDGADHFHGFFDTPDRVASHVKEGLVSGFCTGSPGRYILQFRDGYPASDDLDKHEASLRLAIRVFDNELVFRDLFDLLEWSVEVPKSQCLKLPNGVYHLSLLSSKPESGVRGRNQLIVIYVQPIEQMPMLAYSGVPELV